jgi:GWxTD domain-containing protein
MIEMLAAAFCSLEGEFDVEVRKVKSRNGVLARGFLLAFGLSLLLPGLCAGQKKTKLEKSYRDWLEHDVVYIITKEEREDFLKLSSDTARDKFIADFWETRNPSPGSPANAHKDEIYRRIAFADARFGVGSGMEGWRTDRGRTYITLGEPQQKQVFHNSANLYPFEIWFYAGTTPSLPRAFYVLFYQREGSGDYQFYSPYLDGPDKLTTGVEAINFPGAGLKMIRDSAGPEAARISLSLIPDEPIDLNSGERSLESDILLQKIKGWANLPENRADILRRRTLKESVSARMVLQGRNLDIVALPIRDSRGMTRLDYAIRLHNPSDLSLTAEENGRYTYAVEVRVRVFGPDNRLLFTQQKSVSGSIDKRKFDTVKDRPFGYQGTLPLAPGKYRLDFEFTDWSKKVSFETERDVTVPQSNAQGFVIPGILLFSNAQAVDDPFLRNVAPFTMGGVRFTPLAGVPPAINAEAPLQIVYQIWGPPKDPHTYEGRKLEVQYSLGRPAAPGTAQTVKDEVNLNQFDPTGSLVNGKKFELADKSLGNYLLTATTVESDRGQPTYATIGYKSLGESAPPTPWEVDEPEISKDVETGVVDQQRGLCLLAQGRADEGRRWLRSALRLDRGNDPAREALVEEYSAKHDYAAVVALYGDAGVTEHTNSQTIIRIAGSLQKAGESQKAITLLEGILESRSQDAPLYLALADIYKLQGNLAKAAELETQARSYSGPKSQ